jgi:AcrR family transcriptional regulator
VSPNQRDPVQQRAIYTRERILSAGEYLFSRKGYHKTNSKEIAKTAGVATGSFYAYFKDKREVLLETLERHNRAITARVRKHLESQTPDAAELKTFARTIIDAVIDAHRILPEYHEEIESLKHTDPAIAEMMKMYMEESVQMTYETLARFRHMLKVKDLRTAARIITILIEEIVHCIVFNKETVDERKIIRESAAMIRGYLLKEP